MQGLFFDAPLIGLLELIHVSRKSGVLSADAELPFSISFREGEMVGGGILDWQGLDAIYASPLVPELGSFSFRVEPQVNGVVLAAYGKITADWARYSDDWNQVNAVVGSPSALFQGDLPLFDGPQGRSIRAVSASSQLPLFDVAERVVAGVRAGRLRRLDGFAWYGLRIRHHPSSARGGRLAAAMDGERTLGELVGAGYTLPELRDYLIAEIRTGLRFPGCGWLLRDLLWERTFMEGVK
ncbi:DUF4388 domain-containing protein [Deinococcus sp. KNUC1210]|uniref:DUF4388 domain-containing protein n=1 Tax=Deinococcus sp. KNUC1210 TaxID=2917691 RepID=UPI001EEFF9E1|nr:DUF4388 domain-containing protein [Deinococcus sp. KNUC1210]ULH15557.1 DUF4388 domain-containing protein [Deinococcus sp. KNUC1210]